VLVLIKAVDLEKSEIKEHAHFCNSDTFSFKVKEMLGRGGFTTIYKVDSAFSHTEFTRKRFRIGRGESQNEIDGFKKEL